MLRIAFGLNKSQHSSDMSIRLANRFSADPLGKIFVDTSTHTLTIKCILFPQTLSKQHSHCQNTSEHFDENLRHYVKEKG